MALIIMLVGIFVLLRLRKQTRRATTGSGKDFPSFAQAPPRPDSRASAATAVDLEAQQKQGGHGIVGLFGLGKGEKDMVAVPLTPPLPMQAYAPSPMSPVVRGPNPIQGYGGGPTLAPIPNNFSPETPAYAAPAGPSPLSKLQTSSTISLRTPVPPPPKPVPSTPPPNAPSFHPSHAPAPIVLGMPPRGRSSVASRYSTYSRGQYDDDEDASVYDEDVAQPGVRRMKSRSASRGPDGGKYATAYELRRSRSNSRGRNNGSISSTGFPPNEAAPPVPTLQMPPSLVVSL